MISENTKVVSAVHHSLSNGPSHLGRASNMVPPPAVVDLQISWMVPWLQFDLTFFLRLISPVKWVTQNPAR